MIKGASRRESLRGSLFKCLVWWPASEFFLAAHLGLLHCPTTPHCCRRTRSLAQRSLQLAGMGLSCRLSLKNTDSFRGCYCLHFLSWSKDRTISGKSSVHPRTDFSAGGNPEYLLQYQPHATSRGQCCRESSSIPRKCNTENGLS